jgi:hypothetical protein
MPIHLAEYMLRESDDPVKTDLEPVHTRCRTHLCDAEAGDRMETLFGVIVRDGHRQAARHRRLARRLPRRPAPSPK